MLSAQKIVTRIRASLGQSLSTDDLLGVESLATRAEARTTSGRETQRFSDEDLFLRIDAAQAEIMARCDACLFPTAILPYDATNFVTAGYDPVDGGVLRFLENRFTRNGIRCLVVDATDSNTRRLQRAATPQKPIVSIGGGVVRFYPDATGVTSVAVTAPPPVAALADILLVEEAGEEALVQHVAASCLTSILATGSDVELYSALAQMARAEFEDEIGPYLRNSHPKSRHRDAENSVEMSSR